MTERIYIVKNGTAAPRLVKASTKAQARNHCAKQTFEVAVASQADLVAQLQAGIKIESSTGEEAGDNE